MDPQASTYQIQSPLHDRIWNGRVREIIDGKSKTWNMHLVSEIFYESEANIISKIPVSLYNSPDKLIWRGTKDGKFTVKSAHHLISQMKNDLAGQCSYSNTQNEVWGKIWRLRAPNACKMFLWRATHESLPTNLNLSRRKIRESPLCPICQREEEYVVHVLWLCAAAQDVWGSSLRKLQKMAFQPLHFKHLGCHLFITLTKDKMEFFTATIHKIWKRRNSFVFEDKFDDPATISSRARQLAMEYKNGNSLSVRTIKKGVQIPQFWYAPPLNIYKINWDAAVDSVNCRVGIGVAVRDWNGNLKALLLSKKIVFPDAFLAESPGVLEAVSLCKQLELKSIVLEGDVLNVVKGLNGDAEFRNYPSLLIQDAKNMLDYFHSWSVSHAPRKVNVVAHTLAKEALKLFDERIVLKETPPSIRNLLS